MFCRLQRSVNYDDDVVCSPLGVHVWCEFIMNELLPDRNLGSGQAGSRKLEELADRAAGKQVEAVRHGPMVELACRVAVRCM